MPPLLRSHTKAAKALASQLQRNPVSTAFPDQLRQPFQQYMLSHMPVKLLVALRQTCTLMRHVVDGDTFFLWKRAALQLGVPPELLPKRVRHSAF